MICQSCGNEMRLIKAGTSKKTGKPYPAFYTCDCGNTYNPPDEAKPIIQAKEEAKVNGNGHSNTEMMRLAYRKDLMICCINNQILDQFEDIWARIEK